VTSAAAAEREEPGGQLDGAARGIVAAMAMTGMRRVTKGLGLVEQAPPERMATQGFPRLFALVPTEHRDEAIELAHWAFGAAAGALYGSVPAVIRRQLWAGPAYGLATWVFFETVLGPAVLGLAVQKNRPTRERLAIAADHLLYGAVLSAGSRDSGREPRPL
jgi:uncharacterized membrane protein YagU involved in acid resistance